MSDFIGPMFQPNKPLVNFVNNMNTTRINVANKSQLVPSEDVVKQVKLREKEQTENLVFFQRIESQLEKRDTYVELIRRKNIEIENNKGNNINIRV